MTFKAKFKGKVTKLNATPQFSNVILEEVGTDRVVETTAVTQKLLEKNIGENDTFEVIINEIDGKMCGELNKT